MTDQLKIGVADALSLLKAGRLMDATSSIRRALGGQRAGGLPEFPQSGQSVLPRKPPRQSLATVQIGRAHV